MKLTLPPKLKAKFELPTWATLAASVGMGVLAYFNQQGTFNIDEPWHTMVTVGFAALAGMGIAPIAHGALGTILKLPYATALALSTGLATASVALATTHIDVNVRSVLVGVLTVLSGALAGPRANTAAPVVVAPPTSR